jgi:hypothetical protein
MPTKVRGLSDLVDTYLGTGLRRSEALGLIRADLITPAVSPAELDALDLDGLDEDEVAEVLAGAYLDITQQLKADGTCRVRLKTKASRRRITLDLDTALIIARRVQGKRADAPVFPNPATGGWWHPSLVNKLWEKARAAARADQRGDREDAPAACRGRSQEPAAGHDRDGRPGLTGRGAEPASRGPRCRRAAPRRPHVHDLDQRPSQQVHVGHHDRQGAARVAPWPARDRPHKTDAVRAISGTSPTVHAGHHHAGLGPSETPDLIGTVPPPTNRDGATSCSALSTPQPARDVGIPSAVQHTRGARLTYRLHMDAQEWEEQHFYNLPTLEQRRAFIRRLDDRWRNTA